MTMSNDDIVRKFQEVDAKLADLAARCERCDAPKADPPKFVDAPPRRTPFGIESTDGSDNA